MSSEIVSVTQWTPLIGFYLFPTTLDHLIYLKDALNSFMGRDPIVLGDLNADLGRMGNPQEKHVADFLAFFGLVDIMGHFR